MAQRLLPPILIGITGKRDLLGKDEDVGRALEAAFALLDQRLPSSRKVLLTGLAKGADTVAARIALDRGWKVVAVLPFSVDLFLQDFEGKDAQTLRQFVDPRQGELADPKRGRVIILNPLCDDKRTPYDDAALARRGDEPNPVRADHYEQVGLFIADCAALLIGVMPAGETPDRVGGTARIVEYRLRGAFDDTSERIIEHSADLPPPVPVDAPQFRPAWLLDLDTVDRAASPLAALEIWRRGTWRGPEHAEEHRAAITKIRCTQPEDLIQPLRLAVRIDAFNTLAIAFDDARLQQDMAQRARADAQMQGDLKDRAQADTGDAAALLTQLRSDLSLIQGWNKRRLTLTIKSLAGLFLLAVAALEIVHLEIKTFKWPIFDFDFDWATLYIGASLVILAALFYARAKKLSQFTEDYRAVAEALRVQLVWWNAGLLGREHRVDRSYLCGTTGTLGLVRSGIKYLVGAALLERSPPPFAPAAVARWVEGQVAFFESRTARRQSFVSGIEEVIWLLSIGSIGIGLWLVLLHLPVIEKLLNTRLPLTVWWMAPWGMLLVTFGLGWLSHVLAHLPRHGGYSWRRLSVEGANFLLRLLTGIVFAVFIYFLLSPPYKIAEFLSRTVMDVSGCVIVPPPEPELTPTHCINAVGFKLLGALMGLIAGVAGALRFYTERMALEAELHSYREALATFRRAQHELARLGSSLTGHAKARFEEIVLELGKIALRENEAWIRAHRVRPVEPHV